MTDYRELAADLQILAERLTTAALEEKDWDRTHYLADVARYLRSRSADFSAWAQEDDLR